MINLNSPIDKIEFRKKNFFIKRDDLIDIRFSGNKARKLHYYLNEDNIKTIISFGGNQSNLMYSLSEFAKLKNAKLIYYTKTLPKYLNENIEGNLKYAIQNGMQIVQIPHKKWNSYIEKLKLTKYKTHTLFINQGAMQEQAQFGIKNLANQINEYIKDKKNFGVFVASGTGATALYLRQYLNCPIFTTACVGDEDYLKDEFNKLITNQNFPIVLETNKKYKFGNLYKEFFEIYNELKENTKIEFDLLYDPKGWLTIFENLHKLPENIIYIHCGGILGNETMIKRYERFLSSS
jgi:1-aminocyclopropane-1-carboxylate deaminase